MKYQSHHGRSAVLSARKKQDVRTGSGLLPVLMQMAGELQEAESISEYLVRGHTGGSCISYFPVSALTSCTNTDPSCQVRLWGALLTRYPTAAVTEIMFCVRKMYEPPWEGFLSEQVSRAILMFVLCSLALVVCNYLLCFFSLPTTRAFLSSADDGGEWHSVFTHTRNRSSC